MWGYLDPLPPVRSIARATWLVLRGGLVGVCLIALTALVSTVVGLVLDTRAARITQAACAAEMALDAADRVPVSLDLDTQEALADYWSLATDARAALDAAGVGCE